MDFKQIGSLLPEIRVWAASDLDSTYVISWQPDLGWKASRKRKWGHRTQEIALPDRCNFGVACAVCSADSENRQ